MSMRVFNFISCADKHGEEKSAVIIPKDTLAIIDEPAPFDDVDTSITSFLKQYGQPAPVDIDDADDSDFDGMDDDDEEDDGDQPVGKPAAITAKPVDEPADEPSSEPVEGVVDGTDA